MGSLHTVSLSASQRHAASSTFRAASSFLISDSHGASSGVEIEAAAESCEWQNRLKSPQHRSSASGPESWSSSSCEAHSLTLCTMRSRSCPWLLSLLLFARTPTSSAAGVACGRWAGAVNSRSQVVWTAARRPPLPGGGARGTPHAASVAKTDGRHAPAATSMPPPPPQVDASLICVAQAMEPVLSCLAASRR